MAFVENNDRFIPNREERFRMRNGDVETTFDVGMMYYNQGKYQNALSYFKRAAKGRYSPALCKLGCMYENGEGVRINNVKAFQTYHNAVEIDNNTEAQNNIGTMYLEGLGIPRDTVMAHFWFIQSANLGCQEAAYNLGALYEFNQNKTYLRLFDVVDNMPVLYRLSEHGEHTQPNETLEILNRYNVDRRYLKIAANWYQRALDLGDEDAQEALERLALQDIRPGNN